MNYDDMLQDGLDYQEELDHGIRCPVCGEFVQVEEYSVPDGMCRWCAEESEED